MPYTAGNFTLYPTGNPVVTGTTISSTWANNTLQDIAANGLSNCILKDGTQTVTANIPMSSFKFTGLAAGTGNGDSLRYEQLVGAYLPINGGTLTGNLLFTDATYDIGASGATRPRNIFLSGNAVIGGTINVTGHTTFEGVTSTGATGTGLLVYASAPTLSSPILVTPALGTPASGSLVNCTGVTLSVVTNTLSGDVALTNTATYFDGPSCAQGTSGKWLASGQVTVTDAAGAVLDVKLWDGTTVIASTEVSTAATVIAVSLSGILNTPAANIKISVKNKSHTSSTSIVFNQSGNSVDSTLSVIRIG